MKHKQVLLRERKRHTDRGVSSTPSAALSGGGGGVTYHGWGVPTMDGSTPTPHPDLARGEGHLPWTGRGRGTYLGWGYPSPILTWPRGGYLLWMGRSTYLGWRSPHPDLAKGRGTYLGWGYPSSHPDLTGGGGTHLGWGYRSSLMSWPGRWEGTYLGWGDGYLPWMEVPSHPGVDNI